jgi:hypothetical protein
MAMILMMIFWNCSSFSSDDLFAGNKEGLVETIGPDGVMIVLVFNTMAKHRMSIGHPAQVLWWYLSELCLHSLYC